MLLLSFYQMCILLQYSNESALVLTIEELERRTGINTQELKRHIHGLCNPKLQILTKSSKEDGSPVRHFYFSLIFSLANILLDV